MGSVRILPRAGAISSLLRSYTARVFLVFLLLYVLLVQYARIRCFRDPTSAFFDANRGYRPAYSALRLEQADAFIDQANNGTYEPRVKASENPRMCIGFASVAREGARYFKDAVGTVLAGLSETERADIYLILFIAHADPSQHPAYSEPWLRELADRVLLYDENEVDVDHIRGLETAQAKASAREKALFDYRYLLQACEAVNAPYVVMLEDDVVALDGWYHRTREALNTAEQQTKKMEASKWLYLRLFYTEEFLGWNSEEWPVYLFFSVVAVSTVACSLFGTRRYQPSTHRFLPTETILLLSLVCTPSLIGLFFACGRVSMLPLPAGVNEMPRYGCCSQGFVFPRSRIPELVAWYESKHVGYVDMLTEEYADANLEIRWAVTPSVLQHVGRKSSKADDFTTRPKYHLSMAERLWNFGFELHDPGRLRTEHELAKEQEGFLFWN